MAHHDSNLKAYYKERSPFYDRVYSYPERQDDLRFLESYIPEQFKNMNVLEIAAGTGYWSQFIISRANSILATDATTEVLDQIRNRPLCESIQIKVADAYVLDGIASEYTGAFAGLWYSHIPKQRVSEFLANLHLKILTGATVLFVDNSKAQCNRLPISHKDEEGNTFQNRELDDGSIHQVLKNFPTEEELIRETEKLGKNHKFMELDNFWLFQYIAV